MDDEAIRVLGLDLGTSSIGWALVEGRPKPQTLLRGGVRIFPEGVDRTKGEKSLNQDRRDARQLRRQTYRRVRRKTKFLHLLQQAGLLPKDTPTLVELFRREDPYQLRARALDEKLAPFQIGRALYHLGQRRGYLSNRKAGKERDGAVAKGIGDLTDSLGEKTLGQYFASLDPHRERIRNRYTSRQMYLDEFEKIWQSQYDYHPGTLNVALKQQVWQAIFLQRPLRIQKHLIGKCEFEPDRKRAAKATLVAQQFRLWKDINDIRILQSDGQERWLTDDERQTVYENLKERRDLSWEKLKNLLGLFETDRFNLERVRKSGLLGNITAAVMVSCLGAKSWRVLGEKGQEQLVFDVLNINDDVALGRRLRRHWNFDEKQIASLLEKSLGLPPGHIHLSHKALRKLVPLLLEKGLAEGRGRSYPEACEAVGYDHVKAQRQRDLARLPFPGKLSPGSDTIEASEIDVETVRNPMVERALFQLRRVVNGVIRDYGKPHVIRVELARDLKANRKQREAMIRQQRENERLNQEAEDFLRESGIERPSRSDKLKYRLWQECGQCPFTGEPIVFDTLFGDHPLFQVEHIYPYSRSLDDSYMNKTLCHRDVNLEKGERTPWQAFSSDTHRYEEILQRARKLPQAKYRRFTKAGHEALEKRDFVSQQMNETRYISRQAVAYLKQLGVDVQPVKGGTTALLRRAWGLNGLLSDDGEKTRLDHRHHAVDALVVALTDRSAVQKINRYSALDEGRVKIKGYPSPMMNLRSQAEDMLADIVVSHKAQRRVKGAFHDEFIYGVTGELNKDGTPVVVIRKSLATLSEKDIKGTGRWKLRDERLARLAHEHLLEHGSVKRAFQNPEAPFGFFTSKGEFRPVVKARVVSARSVTAIGRREKRNFRYVWTRSNHHMEIFEKHDNKGEAHWYAHVVSTLEAARRIKAGEDVEKHEDDEGGSFVMALYANDMLRLIHDGEVLICRVEKMDQNGVISFRRHNDADKKDWKQAIRKKPNTLRQSAPLLLEVDAVGNIRIQHGNKDRRNQSAELLLEEQERTTVDLS